MKQEVGRTHSDVFQEAPLDFEKKKPKLEVNDATQTLDDGATLRWRYLKSTTPIEKDVPLTELNGEIGFQKDYCSDPENLWTDLSSPLPFVFFHPVLPLYIDTRKEGSLARYVRRSCKPNAQLDTYLSDGSEYHFWLVSDRYVAANEQITLPWDFRLEKSVGPRWLHLLGLSDDDSPTHDEPEMDESEYTAISNWIDRILSEYGGCACDLENNCAFARFHRHYLHGRSQPRPASNKKKQRKSRNHTISPTSTGHATNSRAPSEGHVEDGLDHDARSQSGSSRSKPSSRDPTPMRQGSFDQLGILTEPTDRDKRKVAMVEDSFRRMEQQQPVRKKKRVSDGTGVPNAVRTKQRTGSTSQGQYVDAGAGRSMSRSPTTTQSPNFPGPAKMGFGRQSNAGRSRQTSVNPRPVYCSVGVQTDPVVGEWYSPPTPSSRPKKRIISLSQRLLNSKHRFHADEEHRKRQPLTPRTSTGSAMEVDPPSAGSRPSVSSDVAEAKSPITSQSGDVPMSDAPTAADSSPVAASTESGGASNNVKIKTPDLRVQMPPVPTFDNAAALSSAATTPQSASTIVQSPFSATNLPTPFGGPAVNGVATQPSPAKKKLSLSDYTKRSMNKAAGKVSGGSAVLKPTLPSPEESKVDITLESQVEAKTEDADHTPMSTLVNGQA